MVVRERERETGDTSSVLLIALLYLDAHHLICGANVFMSLPTPLGPAPTAARLRSGL